MLEVIREEEEDEGSIIDLEHILDEDARKSPTLNLTYHAQFPWFSNKTRHEKHQNDSVLIQVPLARLKSPTHNNSLPLITFLYEEASSVQEEFDIG